MKKMKKERKKQEEDEKIEKQEEEKRKRIKRCLYHVRTFPSMHYKIYFTWKTIKTCWFGFLKWLWVNIFAQDVVGSKSQCIV